MEIINAENKDIYFKYNKKGEIIKIILIPKTDKHCFDMTESWLND